MSFVLALLCLEGSFFDNNMNDNYLGFLTELFCSFVNTVRAYLPDLLYLAAYAYLQAQLLNF